MNPIDQIVRALFETNALRISPPDEPFFYTSGTIGPYYINTHFLFGSESEANELLTLIEDAVRQPMRLSESLFERIDHQYRQNAIYRSVVDALAQQAADFPADFISGGERRDFFFSMPLSLLLEKPHLSILKTGEVWSLSEDGRTDRMLADGQLSGKTVLHVSDLVTEASSYIRTWIPAITRLGSQMPHTLTVVDRDQGGSRLLLQAGTSLHALTVFSAPLFDRARDSGLISDDQHRQVLRFLEDPSAFQSDFLKVHPAFLDDQILKGGKNAMRAQLLKDRFHVG